MSSEKYIPYQGEDYRDDRMYVMNIATAKKDNKNCWNLATYRNILSLSATRNDFFDTKKEVLDYIREVEPRVPLISNNGQPLEIPNHINEEDIDGIWNHFSEWLKERDLFSAVKEISHVPYYMDKKGYKKVIFHATHEIIKR